MVVDEADGPSQTADLLAEPGSRAVYRDDDVTVVVRAAD